MTWFVLAAAALVLGSSVNLGLAGPRTAVTQLVDDFLLSD
jgi:hypothetical protein